MEYQPPHGQHSQGKRGEAHNINELTWEIAHITILK